MDIERLKITAETTAIRGRGWLRLALRLVGIALVLLGAANMFGAELWTGYRGFFEAGVMVVGDPNRGRFIYVADIIVMTAGAVVAHFL
jgi:hypothetical protein